MTETKSKNGFRQFPPALKFVVVWIFILSLVNLWLVLMGLVYTMSIKIISFVLGIVEVYLTIGLVDRSNISRILTSILVGIGTLARIVLLVFMIFQDIRLIWDAYYSADYFLSRSQGIVLIILNVVFNGIVLYILLRPSTKALFSPPPSPPPETTSQEAI